MFEGSSPRREVAGRSEPSRRTWSRWRGTTLNHWHCRRRHFTITSLLSPCMYALSLSLLFKFQLVYIHNSCHFFLALTFLLFPFLIGTQFSTSWTLSKDLEQLWVWGDYKSCITHVLIYMIYAVFVIWHFLDFCFRSSGFPSRRPRNCDKRDRRPCRRREHWIWHLASAEKFRKMMFFPLLTSKLLKPHLLMPLVFVLVCVRLYVCVCDWLIGEVEWWHYKLKWFPLLIAYNAVTTCLISR